MTKSNKKPRKTDYRTIQKQINKKFDEFYKKINEINKLLDKSTKYGYAYTNMFNDEILIGIFNNPEEALEYKHLRDEYNNKISANPEATKDNNPRIIELNKENFKNYNYIYTLRSDGSKRVVKELGEHEDFIPEDWEFDAYSEEV